MNFQDWGLYDVWRPPKIGEPILSGVYYRGVAWATPVVFQGWRLYDVWRPSKIGEPILSGVYYRGVAWETPVVFQGWGLGEQYMKALRICLRGIRT